MAQELLINAGVTFKGKGNLKPKSFPALQALLDMAGTLYECGAQTITQADEVAIEIGGISPTGVGLMVLINTDPDNFVLYGQTGNLINKISPGMFAIVESDGAGGPFAQADTADVIIERYIFAA